MSALAAQSDPERLATVTQLRRRGGGDGLVSPGTTAEFWESLYRQMGRTLHDASTVDAHRIAIAGVALLIEGAAAEGLLAPEAAQEVRLLLTEAVQAPDQL
ncbi:hypothetical protein OG618_37390 (plasmid) [Kitasatospora sp. NBC_01246]|uniref:hypothetical protein n=1 Tax=Kitasatospora sp. NBC_01246 TaxID=2903570 RepID=UPI002E305E4A|nr:hypothetical protein [Kitasatospora sp. NBC_01246]